MRLALGVEYDGRRFCGWQAQKHGVRTVQSEVERALSEIAAESIRVVCAGRTDSGVHALGQVVHLDTSAERGPRNWLLGANANLPGDINLTWARVVPEGFHARFAATGRHYRYVILNRIARSSLLSRRATCVHKPLAADRMHEAGRCLVGVHDFASYRALGCQAKSPVRDLRRLTVSRHGELVVLEVRANAFLHHMVRNIAGVLIAVGKGEKPVSWPADVLALRDRTLGGVTAPAEGLYLTRVEYPDEFSIPEPSTVGLPA